MEKEKNVEIKTENVKDDKTIVKEVIKEKKPFNKHILWAIIPIVLVLLGLLFILNYKEFSDLSAEEILKEMDLPLTFEGYKVSTEVDHIIPSKSKVIFKDSRIEEDEEEYIAGSISVFKNTKQANLYKERVEDKLRITREKITLEEYGYLTTTITYYEYIVVNKNAVLRLNDEFLDMEKESYKTVFDNVVNKCRYTQENIPSNEEMTKIVIDSQKDIEESIERFKDSSNIFVKEMGEFIDKEIKELKTNLKSDILEEIRETIKELYHGNLFTKHREKWDKELKTIEESIAKKAKEAEAKKKAEELRKRTKTLSTGNYRVGEDIEPGKYDAIAKSGNGNFFVYGTGEFDLKVNEIFGVGDGFFDELYNKTYSGLRLETGDRIEITSGLSILFQAK